MEDVKHLSRIAVNLKFLSSFAGLYKYNDWTVTVAFYTSIQIVETVLYRKDETTIGDNTYGNIKHSKDLHRLIKDEKIKPPENYKNTTHEARKLIVKCNFEEISEFFDLLYDSSFKARYHNYDWTEDEINLIIKPALEKILDWGGKELGEKFESPFKKLSQSQRKEAFLTDN